MACISPVHIKSPLHPDRFIYVPCGKCAWCRRAKRNEWIIRFGVEMRHNLYTKFVTLTYDENSVPRDIDKDSGEVYETTDKTHVQKFIKRLRKKGYKFKYFLVSEKGPKSGRPHYHALFFSDDNLNQNVIQDEWPFGFVTVYDSDEGALRYVTKYILKGSDRDDNFMICSKRPSIGSQFVNDDNAFNTFRKNEETGVFGFSFPKNGSLLPMPRYYKKKLSKTFNELDYEINKVKMLKLMEDQPKQYYLEKKFKPQGVFEFDDIQKFEETIKANYLKDYLTQIDINNKE